MSFSPTSRGTVAVLLLGTACFWLARRASHETSMAGHDPAAPASEPAVEDSRPADLRPRPEASGPEAPPARTGLPGRRSPAIDPPEPAAPVSAHAKALIDSIFRDGAEQTLTRQRTAEIQETLRRLQAEGPGALGAIGEFLAKSQDLVFTGPEATALKGSPTLRSALLDIVAGIGGPEAQSLLVNTLRSTAEPAEIQRLARHLEGAVPGEHVADIVTAARETLRMAQAGEIHPTDIGPVFDVLRQHGGSETVGDLEASLGKWGHYSAIALASTPDGIDIILNQARSDAPRKPAHYLFSFQVLAQNAFEHEAAGNGLVDLARDNLIPDSAWPQISQGLLSDGTYAFGKPDQGFTPTNPGTTVSGWKTFSVSQNGQYFYSPPLTTARADLIRSRLELIDRLLATTTQPAAILALNQAKATLGGIPK